MFYKKFIGLRKSPFGQKLNYIHNNPCSGKCLPDEVIRAGVLADCSENYIHSSAGFYYKGLKGIFPVNNITGLMGIDLSEKI